MAFWDSIGKAARGAYYQINPFDRGLTYSDSFRSGEERKRKQQQQAPRPQQPQNTQYVNGLVSGGGVKAQEDRRREVARQAARQQVQNPIGGFLAGVLNKGKSVAEDYVDLNKKGLDLLKDPQKILDGGEVVRKAIVNATPPVQLYNRVRTAQRVQQGRQQVSKYEQDVNNQVKEAFGGQVTNLNDAIKTLSARRSELNPNEKKALLTLLNVNRQIAEDRRTIEEGNLQNVDPVGILEDALVFGGEPVANLTREIFTRGPARIVKELDSNKLGKAMIPFIGETSKGIDVAQESSLGKFIFGRGKVDKASDDIKSFTKDIPILRDIFKYAPLATAGGIAINMPGIGGTKAGKFVKASKELSKVDNVDDVVRVIGKYDDLTKVFGEVDDTLKPILLERLAKETKPKEIQKSIRGSLEATKRLQLADPNVDPLEALKAEARKYKSAEEFVNSKINAYRATSETYNPLKVSLGGNKKQFGTYVTNDLETAKAYLDNRNTIIDNLHLTDKAKVATESDLPKKFRINELSDYKKFGGPQEWQQKAAKWAKDNGYDVMDFGGRNNMTVVNPEALKTKQQLTDLYNQATAPQVGKTDGAADYRSTHQIDSKTSRNLGDIKTLEQDISNVKSKYGLTNYDNADIKRLNSIVGNPEAGVKIYRVSPKGELNSGDWVTTSKTYADDIKRQNGGKVYEYTVKAKDLNLPANIEDNPSLARFSAFQYNKSTPVAPVESKGIDSTLDELQNLQPEEIAKIDDLAKQAGFAGLDDVARSLQPKAVSNISEATPPTINTSYGLGTQATTAIVEKDQPIIRVLRKAEKQTGRKGIVDQFMYDSGLQSRSASIANQKLTSNPNLKEALGGLSKRKLKDLNAYSAARSELSNADRGLQTSLPVSQLQKIVDDLGPQYAGRFERLNAFYKDLASDLRDAGIIDEARYQQFIASPDYVRIQRDMSDLINFKGQGGNTYSLGATITRQKRIGSKRAIKGADVTAFDYTQQVQKEIQRNQTAGNLIDVLAENNLAKRLEPTEAVRKNTIKRIVNGKTEIYEVDPEIKKVIENVAPYQLNTLEKIVAMPKRVFQATTTGLSAPFALANYVKDQVGSAINSKRIIATHSPNNIFSGIFQATKDFGVTNNNEMWQKFIAHAGDTTQYDLTRGTKSAKRLSRELRRGEIGFVANRITSPLKSLEDLIAITEKSTRYQNFRGMYKSLIKKGGNESDALREATLAAWQNSVDFNRYGNWGKTLNLLIPYFNSGIQGSRQLVRSFKNRPIATSIKSIATVGLPIAGVTAWNLSDPERKAIYDNISEFEKENGLVIIPPGPLSQNKDGTYNVWKIPLTQGYNQLFGGVRRAMETYSDKEPTDFGAIALDIIGAVSGPIQTRGGLAKTGSSLIPQGVKPIIQQAANKDFFTGKDIVPDFIENATTKDGSPIPEEKKAFKYTSGSAKAIGRLLGKSPIRVEKFLKDTFGKVGQYGENAADNALAKLGIIKPNEIGGVSVKDDITRRFTKAQGEYNYKKSDGAKYFDDVKAVTSSLNGNEKSAYDTLHPQKTSFLGEDIFDENKRLTSFQKAGIYLQYPKVFEADRALDKKQRAKGNPGNPIFDLPKDQLTRILLKATLPPGAKDPELSKLWEKDWYQDYNAKRTKYYEAVKKSLKKQGKTLPKSNNPYPETPKNLQKVMDYYSSLPKGTGDRSNWIESNPTLWKKMTKQWEAVDNWENKERVKLGLDKIAPEDQLGATSNKYGYGSSGEGGKSGKSGKTAKDKRVPLSSLTSYIRGLGTDIPDVASQIRAPEVRLNLPRPVASRAKRVKIKFR